MKKTREQILKDSIDKYLKQVDGAKLISEQQLNDIIHEEKREYENVEKEYKTEKQDYKNKKSVCKNLVFTTLLPIVITSTISLSTMGICHACKDKIGQGYDEYYKNNYVTTAQTIDNVDYKLKEETIKLDKKPSKKFKHYITNFIKKN